LTTGVFMPAVLAFVILLLAAACAATSTDEGFDLRLREMAGHSERDLLSSMGRIPDNSYQLDDQTKVLQWRWDTSYISPGSAPMYRRVGGMWMPLGGFPPTLVREGCIVEWTVAQGTSQTYRWQGNGCRLTTLASVPTR
jgi:hypothetical protein